VYLKSTLKFYEVPNFWKISVLQEKNGTAVVASPIFPDVGKKENATGTIHYSLFIIILREIHGSVTFLMAAVIIFVI
jgi:hypothetical protein